MKHSAPEAFTLNHREVLTALRRAVWEKAQRKKIHVPDDFSDFNDTANIVFLDAKEGEVAMTFASVALTVEDE